MDILVNVSNQKLKLETNLHSLVEGSQKFVRFVFDLSSEWDGLLVFAQFTQNGNSYNQYLDDNNCVYLPAEIVAGECTVMLYGSGHTVIGTTNYLTLHINDSILVSDAESTDITESLYNQLVSMVLDMEEKIDKKQNTWFATCSSPAYGSKEATTTTGDFVLAAGNSVRVHFSTSNYATNPTLNVDGTGAVDIRSVHTGVPWAGALPTYTWGVGEVVDFVYDGTYFVIVDGLTATTSIYGATKLSTSHSSTATDLAATPSAVKAAYDLANGKVSDVKVNGTSTVSGGVASVTVPTATSDLTNDSNFVSDADYVHTDNNYTDSDASKLNGISEGATATSVTQRLQSGTKIAEIDVDGVTTDIYAPSGGGGGGTQNIWYATCSTSYSTTAKIATTTSGDFVLATGNMVRVRFTDHNQNSSPTLNVDGTGATAIRTTAFTSPYNQLWTSGEVVDFVYDGTYFIMSDGGKASTSVYGVTKLSTSTSSTDTDLAATPSAVKAAYDLADSKVDDVQVDGVSVVSDGVASITMPSGGTKNVWYGTCGTTSSATAKVVTTTTGDFALTTGNMVRVEFELGNTAATSTLSVDGTTPTTVAFRYGNTLVDYAWQSGEVVDFVYDGTYFVMSSGGRASVNYYGETKLSSSTTSTATDLAATPSAVKAAYDLADSKVSDVEVNGTSVVSGGVASVTVPTVTSDLTNDSNFVSDASYVHTDNNFTNADATKLSGIEAGAEVNVQSDWTQADSTADDYIKNKPTIPTVNDGTLTIQQNGSSVGTFSANQSGNSTANITVPAQNIWYGTCDTGISTAGKVVTTTTGDFTLATGNMVRVKFNNYNTESSPTLNVDNTGTVSLKIYGTTDSLSRMWRSGEVVDFVYDGTYFVMSDGGTADTNYYGVVKLASSVSSNSTSTGANSLAVKTAYDLADSKSTVSVTQTLSSGTKIGDITVDGTTTNLYAPSGGSGGVSDVLVDNVSVVTGGVAEIDLSDYVKEDANGDISVTGGATFGDDVDVNGAVNSENLPGIIKMFAGTFAPTGWLLCNGDEVAIEDYPFLYDVIGDTYGTPSDSDHFVLPDFRGRSPLGAGIGTASDATLRTLGQEGGSERVTLSANQSGLRAHTHGFTQPTVNGGSCSITSSGAHTNHTMNGYGATLGTGSTGWRFGSSGTKTATGIIEGGAHTHTVPAHTHTVTNGAVGAVTGGAVGASESHGNMPPYLTVNYIISTGGASRWSDSAGLPIVRDVTVNGQSVVNNEIASIPTGTVYQFGWNKTSAGGTGTAITGEATLPAGTYIIVVQAPVISATTTMQIQGISDKYFTASHNHETSSWVVTFNTATATQLQMAQSGTVTFSYTERGGMKAIRIA